MLWQEDIGRLELEQCYKLTDVTLRCFQGETYLSVSSNSTIKKVDDIGEVAEMGMEQEAVGAKVIPSLF